MPRKRPCSICRCWFVPHARAGDRQRVCSKPECQRARHRRSCADWHARHPGYDREERLRKKVRPPREGPPRDPEADPLAEIDWDAARDAVGVESTVFVEETQKVIVAWARDAVRAQMPRITGEIVKQLNRRSRDAIGGRAPPG